MRRAPGLHGIAVAAKTNEQFRILGEETQAKKLATMRTQLATFKTSLEQFAAAHRDDIRKDPAFRQQFHAMCANIGVDPLVSNKGGTWANKLGLGDFYYALAVTVLDVCKARRAFDGGFTELSLVLRHVQRRRGSSADPISAEDIVRAIEKLSVLGGGLGIVNIGNRPFVRSVPAELSTDGNALIDLAHKLGGFFTRGEIAANLRWEEERMNTALTALAKDGLLLVDDPPTASARGGGGGGGVVAGRRKKDAAAIAAEKQKLAANRIYWCPAVGMEAAVEEFQRREKLPVVGFKGLGTIENRTESAMELTSD
jgi:ESCRT-II complex subunit VPS22